MTRGPQGPLRLWLPANGRRQLTPDRVSGGDAAPSAAQPDSRSEPDWRVSNRALPSEKLANLERHTGTATHRYSDTQVQARRRRDRPAPSLGVERRQRLADGRVCLHDGPAAET